MGVMESSLNDVQRRPPLVRSTSASAKVLSVKCVQERDFEHFQSDATAHVSVFADEVYAVYKARGQQDCHNCNSECCNMAPATYGNHVRRAADSTVLEDINSNSEIPLLNMQIQEENGIIHGIIRVHMNLIRPISVVAPTQPSSIYDVLHDEENVEKTLTSFYLPKDTVKALHITSETTTVEVIAALLKKFRVVDSPKKFALYEHTYEQEEKLQVKMRRISDNSKPLLLALHWSRDTNSKKGFVLQENDTGDILWEAFTLPELKNFLLILDHEEEQYKKIIKEKYKLMELKIKEAIKKIERESIKRETDL